MPNLFRAAMLSAVFAASITGATAQTLTPATNNGTPPAGLVAVGTAATTAPTTTLKASELFTEAQQQAIRAIVSEVVGRQQQAAQPLDAASLKSLLAANPNLISEAMAAAQNEQDRARQETMAKAIKGSMEDLLSDPDSVAMGSVEPDVTVIGFIDYNCGYCKRSSPTIAQLLKQDSRVRYLAKEFPILSDGSRQAALVVMAAMKQGKAAELHERLMSSAAPADEAAALNIAGQLGMDVAKLKTDMNDPAVKEAVGRHSAAAQNIGIGGTPFYIIASKDGRFTVQPGAADLPTMANHVKMVRGS